MVIFAWCLSTKWPKMVEATVRGDGTRLYSMVSISPGVSCRPLWHATRDKTISCHAWPPFSFLTACSTSVGPGWYHVVWTQNNSEKVIKVPLFTCKNMIGHYSSAGSQSADSRTLYCSAWTAAVVQSVQHLTLYCSLFPPLSPPFSLCRILALQKKKEGLYERDKTHSLWYNGDIV